MREWRNVKCLHLGRPRCFAPKPSKTRFCVCARLRACGSHIPFQNLICESGGTGRRARLRGVWFTPYGFKSRFSHQGTLFVFLYSAGMAELADALDSGSSEVTFVQVQVLLPAPEKDSGLDTILSLFQLNPPSSE